MKNNSEIKRSAINYVKSHSTGSTGMDDKIQYAFMAGANLMKIIKPQSFIPTDKSKLILFKLATTDESTKETEYLIDYIIEDKRGNLYLESYNISYNEVSEWCYIEDIF